MRSRTVVLLVTTLAAVASCSKPCLTNQCKKEARYLRNCLKPNEDPCTDFYEFSCGKFRTSSFTVNDSLSWGPFEIANNATDHAVRAILSSPKKRTDSGALTKAKTMYAACMDDGNVHISWETRQQRGLRPLLRMIKNLGDWPLISDSWNGSVTWGHVARLMAQYGVPIFFEVTVKPHPSNTSLNVIHLNAPSMTMPVALRRSPRQRVGAVDILAFPNNKDDIVRYLTDVALELRDHVGATHAHKRRIKKQLLDVVDLAGKMQVISTILGLQAPSGSGIVPISSLDSHNGQMDWLDFLQTVFRNSGVNLTSEHLVYVGGIYVTYILQLFGNSSSRLLANYIVSHLVMHLAPETTERMRGFLIRLYRKLQLITDNYPSWHSCINKVLDYPNTGLGAAMILDYMKDNFRPENTRRVMQLLEDLQVASEELLDQTDWIDEETRRLVTDKMDAMTVLAGFPRWYSNASALDRFYDKLVIHHDDHFGNVARMRSFLYASNLATLDKKEDPEFKWNYSPFLVNALYELRTNSITLPAGMMQHPFYTGQDNKPRLSGKKKRVKKARGRGSRKSSRAAGRRRSRAKESVLLALDYGRFGSVVGHEITHGFDDDGRLYDGSGETKNQWSYRMQWFFFKRAHCFRRQYGLKNHFLLDTLGEDIADNGGVRKAFRAFKRAWSRAGGVNATLPRLPSFTPDQLFFIGYATLWCHSGEEFSLDDHSSHRDRVNKPLSNMKEFADAWNCAPDSPMNPRDKCVLW